MRDPVRAAGCPLTGLAGRANLSRMPRWLQFALGLVTLIALAAGIVRTLVRHMPDAVASWLGPWAYEALILLLAVSVVAIIVRAAQGYRSPRSDKVR